MNTLYKTLNKFNGNLCFAGRTDLGQDILMEADRLGENISSVYPTNNVTDICLNDANSYLIAFSSNWLGKFENGVLNEYYWNVLTQADMVVRAANRDTYVLNRDLNLLSKVGQWTYNLPDDALKSEGKIVLRESDSTIIYHNNSRLYVIWDDTTSARVVNSIDLLGSGNTNVVLSGEYNPDYLYANAETASGAELDFSSSSSMGYSTSSSSSSSSISSSSSSSSSISSQSSSSSSSSFGCDVVTISPPMRTIAVPADPTYPFARQYRKLIGSNIGEIATWDGVKWAAANHDIYYNSGLGFWVYFDTNVNDFTNPIANSDGIMEFYQSNLSIKQWEVVC